MEHNYGGTPSPQATTRDYDNDQQPSAAETESQSNNSPNQKDTLREKNGNLSVNTDDCNVNNDGDPLPEDDVEGVNPGTSWNFITFTRHNYHVTPRDDKHLRICWTTIVLGILVLQQGYSGSKGYYDDTSAQVLKIVINVLSAILIAMLIEYRFLNIRIDMRKWQSEDIGFSFRSHTCMRNLGYLIMEIILVLPQPIPFIQRVDKLALLMVLRLFFSIRLIRDFHPLYRKRREIWKDPRLLYCHNPEMFNTMTSFRMTFRQPSVSSYSFYVADRGSEPHTNWLDWIYLTVITATTVGYGDYSPQTSISKVVAMITALSGTVLTALLVGAITSALTPSDFQKEASTWLEMQKQKKERRDFSAQFIQLVWRRYIRQQKYHTRNHREERQYNRKCIRIITRLRHLRKSAQWTKVASAHPLQSHFQELEANYITLKAELQNTNAKLDQILKAISTKTNSQGETVNQIGSPAAAPRVPNSPDHHPSVMASPPTF